VPGVASRPRRGTRKAPSRFDAGSPMRPWLRLTIRIWPRSMMRRRSMRLRGASMMFRSRGLFVSVASNSGCCAACRKGSAINTPCVRGSGLATNWPSLFWTGEIASLRHARLPADEQVPATVVELDTKAVTLAAVLHAAECRDVGISVRRRQPHRRFEFRARRPLQPGDGIGGRMPQSCDLRSTQGEPIIVTRTCSPPNAAW